MVVYYCGSLIRYADIPHELWEDVDACIAAGDEILVGNDGFGHRVYGRCKSRQYVNASVCKTTKPYPKLSCDEELVQKCDFMVAVWDGESHEVLVNILLLLALQKKCRLYYLPSDSCIEISSVDELEPLVPDREGWTPQLVRKILKACGFGKEMLDHMLESGIPSESVLTDIVCRAPVPLKKKHEMLDLLIKKTNVNYETLVKGAAAIREGCEYARVKKAVSEVSGVFGDSLHDAVRELSLAEMGLKHCMYYLFDEWYDHYVLIVKSYPCGLFGTLKQVKRYIKKAAEWEREVTVEPNPGWYRIEAWDLNGWDKYELGFNYYVYNGEICWFERMETLREVNGLEHYVPADERFYRGVFDLSVPTPFKAGDIVNIDCSPFGSPFRALVVEGVEQYDCWILFKVPFTDNWRITALKHKRFYKNADVGMYEYEPRLSPLYRLRSVGEDELGRDAESAGDDELLIKISKWISGNEERGAAFWKTWYDNLSNEMTDEEVEEILRLSASIGK